MSPKAVRILACAGGVALTVLAVTWVTATAGSGREPRFSGRTADEWQDRAGSAEPATQVEAAAMLSQAVVPGLVQTLRRPEVDSGIHRTLVSLWNAVPGVSVESPTEIERRVVAANELGVLGTHAAGAVDALLEPLTTSGTDPELRSAAAAALGRIGAQPARVIPVLLTELQDPESAARAKAAFALAAYGSGASNAVPVLLGLLQVPMKDKDLWTSVRFALREIAPDAATRAGIR